MKNYKVTDKTGPVVAMKLVTGQEDILLVSDDGTILRTDAGAISVYGRSTQGVRLMRVAEGSRIISIACADKEEAEDASAGEEPQA